MKKFIIIFSLLHVTLHGTIKEVTLRIDQMTCPICVQGVRKKLAALPFVQTVGHINLNTGTVTLFLTPDNTQTKESLEHIFVDVIHRAGFVFDGFAGIKE